MISGESGSGKEADRAVHLEAQSSGAEAVCRRQLRGDPDNLIESELLRPRDAAPSRARRAGAGKFEQCDGGTIFLDEIGDMALAAQASILRRGSSEGEIQRRRPAPRRCGSTSASSPPPTKTSRRW